jgi:CO/xanthine dehydrogenase Mo-binding subunit
MSVVGRSIPRSDALAKVNGQARFADDHSMPDALHMRILFSGRPHASIEFLDIKNALSMPGVTAVLTGADVPNNIYGLVIPDQQVLCTDIVRFVGDQVAAVVAETPDLAEKALRRIHVGYRDLPAVDSTATALKPSASQIHPRYPGNVMKSIRIRRGNTSEGFARAALILENEYFTPAQEHAYLEPEAGLAYLDEHGCITVLAAGQNPHDDQRQIAEALAIPLEKVRVKYGPVGGAFGGREDVSVQILLALAALRLGRPVRIRWSRTESIIGHCKRHAMTIRHKWGVDDGGRILAAEVDIIADAGPYAYTSPLVLECLDSLCVGPYDIPNVSMDGHMVCTNNIPSGAFRGFGGPQVAFAAEQQIERLADRLGIDPVTMRLRNCLRDGSLLPTQSSIPGKVSLPRLIDKCAHQLGFRAQEGTWQHPEVGVQNEVAHGYGISAGMRHSGFGHGFPEGSEARAILYGSGAIEQVVIHSAAPNVGQGSHDAFRQIAAQALDVPLEIVRFDPSDTLAIGDSGGASASRLTYVAGNSVALAALAALERWRAEDRPASATATWHPPATTAPDPETGECVANFTYSFAAHGAEVEVDTETGEIRVRRVVAVHDVGRAVNPAQAKGQIQGGVVQAYGWTLLENFLSQGGQVLSDQLSTYLIPTSLDIPAVVDAILIEEPDPNGPFGVRGLGEIPFVPLASAVTNAIHDATGIWLDILPVTPERMLEQLAERLEQHQV